MYCLAAGHCVTVPQKLWHKTLYLKWIGTYPPALFSICVALCVAKPLISR